MSFAYPEVSYEILIKKVKDYYNVQEVASINGFILEIFDDCMMVDLSKFGTDEKELISYVVDEEDTIFKYISKRRAFFDRYVSKERMLSLIAPNRDVNLTEEERKEHRRIANKKYDDGRKEAKRNYNRKYYMERKSNIS